MVVPLLLGGCSTGARDPVAAARPALVSIDAPAHERSYPNGIAPLQVGEDLDVNRLPGPESPAYAPEAQATLYRELAVSPLAADPHLPRLPYNFGEVPGITDGVMRAGSAWREKLVRSPSPDAELLVASGTQEAMRLADRAGVSATANPEGYVLGALSFGASQWKELLDKGAPEWLKDLGIDITTERSDYRGYPVARGRWLKSGYEPRVWGSVHYEQPRSYADPAYLADMRERGARLYCAAREAQQQQHGGMSLMTTHTAAHVRLFKQDFDLFNLDQFIGVDGPMKFDGGDGAMAFAVPLQLGTRFSPLRVNGDGLIFGELRTPIVFTAGDSEVVSAAELRDITVGVPQRHCSRVGNICWTSIEPQTVRDWAKQYQTITHGDGIYVQGGSGLKWHKTWTLATVGVLSLDFTLGVELEHGNVTWGNDGLLLSSQFAGGLVHRGGYATRNALSGVTYHDGAWSLASNVSRLSPLNACPSTTWIPQLTIQGVVNDDPDAGWRLPAFAGLDTSCTHHTYGAYDLRALMDDDHSLSVGEKAALTGTISAAAGREYESNDGSSLKLALKISGGLSANIELSKAIRDGALLVRDEHGVTSAASGLTIRPRVVSNIDFNPPALSLVFEMRVRIPIWNKVVKVGAFEKKLFPWDKSSDVVHLVRNDTDEDPSHPFDEETYFRLVTGGTRGDAIKQPDVRSHLPHAREFPSFPKDVDACLADEKPLPPLGAALAPAGAAVGITPTAYNMCLWGEAPLFRDGNGVHHASSPLCANVDSAYPTGDPHRDCVRAYYHFLCSAASSHEVSSPAHPAVPAVVRRWDPDVPEQRQAYQDAIAACAPWATQLDPDASESALTTITSSLTNFAACDDAANIVSADDAVWR
jgi:hypothetical protein